jgi:hypothetical protein
MARDSRLPQRRVESNCYVLGNRPHPRLGGMREERRLAQQPLVPRSGASKFPYAQAREQLQGHCDESRSAPGSRRPSHLKDRRRDKRRRAGSGTLPRRRQLRAASLRPRRGWRGCRAEGVRCRSGSWRRPAVWEYELEGAAAWSSAFVDQVASVGTRVRAGDREPRLSPLKVPVIGDAIGAVA